jgi:hypothetical protein
MKGNNEHTSTTTPEDFISFQFKDLFHAHTHVFRGELSRFFQRLRCCLQGIFSTQLRGSPVALRETKSYPSRYLLFNDIARSGEREGASYCDERRSWASVPPSRVMY